jgi:UDP-2,3-diacylglucosamine pyrophosphatase LpxH
MSPAALRQSFRTILISDLHLGSVRCDAEKLCDFLGQCRAETIFIVGDTFDFWSLRAGAAWSAQHDILMKRLCDMLRQGSRIILIPGNHDSILETFTDLPDCGIEIHRDYVHETARGERFLIVHGHEQDAVLDRTGSFAPAACAFAERLIAAVRRLFPFAGMRKSGRRHHRLTAQLWEIIRRSFGGIDRFERAVIEEARRRNLDGVVCGHTHMAADRILDGVRYLNCGDWVGSCTAITESWFGEMQLLRWAATAEPGKAPAAIVIWGDADACLPSHVAEEMP